MRRLLDSAAISLLGAQVRLAPYFPAYTASGGFPNSRVPRGPH